MHALRVRFTAGYTSRHTPLPNPLNVCYTRRFHVGFTFVSHAPSHNGFTTVSRPFHICFTRSSIYRFYVRFACLSEPTVTLPSYTRFTVDACGLHVRFKSVRCSLHTRHTTVSHPFINRFTCVTPSFHPYLTPVTHPPRVVARPLHHRLTTVLHPLFIRLAFFASVCIRCTYVTHLTNVVLTAVSYPSHICLHSVAQTFHIIRPTFVRRPFHILDTTDSQPLHILYTCVVLNPYNEQRSWQRARCFRPLLPLSLIVLFIFVESFHAVLGRPRMCGLEIGLC